MGGKPFAILRPTAKFSYRKKDRLRSRESVDREDNAGNCDFRQYALDIIPVRTEQVFRWRAFEGVKRTSLF